MKRTITLELSLNGPDGAWSISILAGEKPGTISVLYTDQFRLQRFELPLAGDISTFAAACLHPLKEAGLGEELIQEVAVRMFLSRLATLLCAPARSQNTSRDTPESTLGTGTRPSPIFHYGLVKGWNDGSEMLP